MGAAQGADIAFGQVVIEFAVGFGGEEFGLVGQAVQMRVGGEIGEIGLQAHAFAFQHRAGVAGARVPRDAGGVLRC